MGFFDGMNYLPNNHFLLEKNIFLLNIMKVNQMNKYYDHLKIP